MTAKQMAQALLPCSVEILPGAAGKRQIWSYLA